MKQRKIMAVLIGAMLVFCGCAEKKQPEEGKKADNIQVESGGGEGASPKELADLSESPEHGQEESVRITADDLTYELQIDTAVYTDERNRYVEAAENVIAITYTGKNLSDHPVMIGDICFQLTDDEQSRVYEPYYFETGESDVQIEPGESASGKIAFSGMEADGKFVLVYTDYNTENPVPVMIQLDHMENK